MKYDGWVFKDNGAPDNGTFKTVATPEGYYHRGWLTEGNFVVNQNAADWSNYDIECLIKEGTWVPAKEYYLNKFANEVQ